MIKTVALLLCLCFVLTALCFGEEYEKEDFTDELVFEQYERLKGKEILMDSATLWNMIEIDLLKKRIQEIDDGLNGLGAIYYDLSARIEKLEKENENEKTIDFRVTYDDTSGTIRIEPRPIEE